ncbi:hypothetical protein HELRODRAFT_162919 [Helobdella robusta]|uniref:Uncharacterized protein n=1 Tax=Helobdella robusta TaxID=6412 RepID=T1ETC9_HELRO|nr:hypothetical protein HELRODRAFT_162919 [Helobdella robusta]ESN99377.1 hypothetical protein HELRODRAFT_162919 [Helobdella robusta]
MTAENLKRLERTEMQILRRIMGVSLRNSLSNESLSTTVSKDPEITKIHNAILIGIQNGVNSLLQYVSSWDTCKEIWNVNKTEFIEKYKSLNPPVSSFDTDIYRWVLRSALNFASDGEVVREVGREFQRKGPEKAKADLAKECLTRVKKKREEDDRKPGRLEGLSLRHIESDQVIIEERHRDKL